MKKINFDDLPEATQKQIWKDLYPGIIPSDGTVGDLILYDSDDWAEAKHDGDELILLNIKAKEIGFFDFENCAIEWYNK